MAEKFTVVILVAATVLKIFVQAAKAKLSDLPDIVDAAKLLVRQGILRTGMLVELSL